MPHPAPSPVRPRRWLVWLRRLVIGLPVLLVGADVGMHVAGLRALMPLLCVWDPRIGCVTKPNIMESLEFLNDRFEFTTNADGLRNAPIAAKKPGWRRVLVLGDSVTFAPQVADGATFPNLLDLDLFKDQVEVVNAGSPYLEGTQQELSWFLDVGARFQPDLVVLEFTERNDFADNEQQRWWRPTPNGLERQTNVQPPAYQRWVLQVNESPVVRWLDAHSRAFGLARIGFWHLTHLPRMPWDTPRADHTAEVLLRLKQEVETRGAQFAVVVYPSPQHLAGVRGERESRAEDDNARILAIITVNKINCLDLTPALLPETARPWVGGDGHLTADGHRAVADLLLPQLRAWLPPRAD